MVHLHTDVEHAFGTLRALLAKRKRLLTDYEFKKNYRWHGEPVLRSIRHVEFDIRWELFIKPEGE